MHPLWGGEGLKWNREIWMYTKWQSTCIHSAVIDTAAQIAMIVLKVACKTAGYNMCYACMQLQCDVLCREGVRRRSVTCRNSRDQSLLPDFMCAQTMARPASSESCSDEFPQECFLDPVWVPYPWTEVGYAQCNNEETMWSLCGCTVINLKLKLSQIVQKN